MKTNILKYKSPELNSISNLFNMLDDFNFFTWPANWDWHNSPILSSKELEGDKIQYEFDVPGFTKEDLELNWKNDLLTIKGSSKKYNKKITYTLSVVESDFDINSTDAICENGVLSIILKRKNETTKNNIKISIK